MRNLILLQTNIFKTEEPLAFHIDEFSKVIVVLDKYLNITIYNYDDIFSKHKIQTTIELEAIFYDNIDLLQKITKETIKFFYYKSEEESIHLILTSGEYIKVNPNNNKHEINNIVENKKILCAEISPNLEFIAVALSDFKLLLLNYEFELIKSCELDDGDLSDSKMDEECSEASISWRGDTQYFACLYSVNGGKKCLVRDTKLNVLKGPARADNKVVFSVAENPVQSI
jgi:hypothetical protein